MTFNTFFACVQSNHLLACHAHRCHGPILLLVLTLPLTLVRRQRKAILSPRVARSLEHPI